MNSRLPLWRSLAHYGRWMRIVELWQLLQSPVVGEVGIVWVSGHLLADTVIGKEMLFVV